MTAPDEIANKVLWRIPNVLCLIGAADGDIWNGMTASWVTQVAVEPVLVAVAVDTKSLTHRLIAATGSFSVNLWNRDDTRPFVKFSKPAQREGNTLNGHPVRAGVTGAPIFEEAVAFIECRVWRQVDCGTHTLFVGELVDCGLRDAEEDTPIARMEDTRMKYGGVKRGGR